MAKFNAAAWLNPVSIGIVGVVAFGLYVLAKKQSGQSIGNAAGRVAVETAADVVVGSAQAAGDVVAGGVVATGGLLGIPETNESKCAAAQREGRLWDASFQCPAKDFVGDVWRRATSIF